MHISASESLFSEDLKKDRRHLFSHTMHPSWKKGQASRGGASQRASVNNVLLSKEERTILWVPSEWFFPHFPQNSRLPQAFLYFLSTQVCLPQTNSVLFFSLPRWAGLEVEEKTASPDISSTCSFFPLFFKKKWQTLYWDNIKRTEWGNRMWVPERLPVFWAVILKWLVYYLARPQ